MLRHLHACAAERLNYSGSRVHGSRVIGANMGCKGFVALQLEVPHHFIQRIAAGRTRSVEQPATFGATKTPKQFFVDPDKPAGRLSFRVGL
jgi:hypothetical protein